jgi:hypothetical protein
MEICGCAGKISACAGPQWIESPLPIRAMLFGLSKNFGSFDNRFTASHSFFSYEIACEAVQISAAWTFVVSGGHSAFPDQRTALFRSRFQ